MWKKKYGYEMQIIYELQEIFIHIYKNKNDWWKKNSEVVIHMKKQVWLRNVKYLRLSLNTSWALVFCIDTHVCTISKFIGRYKEN